MARIADPVMLFADAGLPPPHEHQVSALRNWRQDYMLLWTRQGGKSTAGAVLACHNLLFPSTAFTPTIVICSRAERQSGELFRKARQTYSALPYAPGLVTDSATVMETPTGGRILAYPGSEESVRGLSSVTLALIDEGTLVAPELRTAISPMLSTTNGPTWAMGTARSRSGWFYDDWEDPELDFIVKSKVTHEQVPHLSADYIAKEKIRMPQWEFDMEYSCIFHDHDAVQLITRSMIEQAMNPAEVALW